MLLINLITNVLSFFTSIYFLAIVGCLLWIAVFLHLYMTRNFGKLEKKYGVKGMKPMPFLGTEMDTLTGTKSIQDAVLEKYKFFEGERFGITYLGSRPTIFVRDVELLKRMCVTDFDHFQNFFGDGISSVADHNLFFTNGEKWRRAKTALSQVYRLKNVKEILPKLNSCVQEAMHDLNSFTKTGEEVLFEENVIDPCLLTAVARAVCGVEISGIKDQSSEFSKMVKLLQSSVWRFIMLIVAPGFMSTFGIRVFPPKASNYLMSMLKNLLEDHKKTRKFDDLMGIHLKVKEEVEHKKQEEVKSTNISKTEEEMFPVTDDMILSSCMQFFFDGVASVSSMISVAIFALAKDQDLQDRAFEEIQNVMGDRMYGPDGSTNIKDLPEVTDNDLQEMKLMTQIFTEASRLGAFPFINRMCTKDYKIPGSDFIVTKGTPVYVPIYGIHMDPKLWPEPEKFNPDRFAPENKDNIVNGALIPFGQGQRMCLGKNYVGVAARTFLINLFRSFKVLPGETMPEKLEWDMENLGRVAGGLRMKVVRRDE